LGRFFKKVFHETKKKELVTPSLPLDLSLSDLMYRTKRGFLARKLGQYLGLSRDELNSMFLFSLSKTSFPLQENENLSEYILSLSERMLNWSETNQNIPRKIEQLNIRNDFQNAMLKAYEIYKHDLFSNPQHAVEHERSASTKKLIDEKWYIYRDVIFAATQGKFQLITKEEVNQYKKGIVLCEGIIKDRSDIPKCRNLAKESLEKQGVNSTTVMEWLLVLSEAITNTIKHAEEGKMTLIKDDITNEFRCVVEDKGPGFSLKELPKLTLLAGYSTKKSLGQGFTLMIKMAKSVLLYTTPKGSVIILEFGVGNKINRVAE